MNKNIFIVLAGGFLIAILVAVMVQASLGGKKKEEDVPRVQVLVAAKNLSVGREIQDGDLEWQDWPEDALFSGAIMRDGEQEVLDVAQGKLLRPLVEGQPVHMNVLVEEDQGDFLSANVEKGMRAVGIQVKSYVVADRLIRPGDYVDVIMTYKIKVNTRNNPQAQSLVNKYASETILEKVRVLAIDTEDTKAVDEIDDGKKKKKKKSKKKAIVTLEVTPEGAEKLLLGTEMG
ncbi:MAG: Flp pilus assembly protein CpaB, partial [Alphaproteobacteria bacterium]|nr:Flp pilus assembly protein CpaB [Alphaproteobacteria bacterium]